MEIWSFFALTIRKSLLQCQEVYAEAAELQEVETLFIDVRVLVALVSAEMVYNSTNFIWTLARLPVQTGNNECKLINV